MPLLDRLRRSSKAAPKPAETKELGRSGTVNLRGFLTSEERNAALVWPRNLEVYDEMARTDPTCRWSLALVTNPLLAADEEIEPASQEPEDLEVAAFVEHALFERLESGFDDFLRRALLYLRYGHQVFERVAAFEPVRFSYETEDGERRDVDREAFVISRLGQRLSRTIEKWIPDERDPAKLVAIEQWLTADERQSVRVIPAERLVIFTNEKEGDDWRGVSVLRSAYFPYKTKLKLENIEAIGLERSAGLPIVYPPDNATPAQKDAMEQAVEGLRQGENLWIMMPGPKADATKDTQGWLIEDLQIQGDADRSPSEAIQRYEAAMARNVLAEFMRLGHENVGARATADVQQEPYWQILGAIGSYVEQVVNEQVIEPLVRWNYEVRECPRFKFGKMQSRNVQILATAFANLAKNGIITPDPELENYLRRVLDAPELDADQREQLEREKMERAQEIARQAKPEDEPDRDSQTANRESRNGDQPARMSERAYRRPLRPEEFYVALTEVERSLDDAADDLVQAAEEAAREPIERLRAEVDQAIRRRSPELVAKLTLDPAPLVEPIERVLSSIYVQGRQQVRSELRRQGAGARFQEGDPTRAELLAAKAQAIAASIAAAATRALRAFGLRAIEDGAANPTAVGFEPLGAVRDEARKAAAGYVNGAWGNGRRDEMLARSSEIETAIYSAILDDHTCSPCTEADGREGPAGGDPALPVPNPDCHGGGRCRCMWVAVVAEAAVRLPVAASEAAKAAVQEWSTGVDTRIAALAERIEQATEDRLASFQQRLDATIRLQERGPEAQPQEIHVHNEDTHRLVESLAQVLEQVKALAEREPPAPVVNMPEPKKSRRRVRFIHDDDGRPTGAEVEDV